VQSKGLCPEIPLTASLNSVCRGRNERSEVRRDTRAGHYERKLQTKAGEVTLRIPKLRTQTFERAIIEPYRRRESSVEEALIEIYWPGSWYAGSRTHRSTVGHPGVALYGLGTEQDLRNNRGLAQPANRGANILTFISTASCSSVPGRAKCANVKPTPLRIFERFV
jgi:hypothetical protein